MGIDGLNHRTEASFSFQANYPIHDDALVCPNINRYSKSMYFLAMAQQAPSRLALTRLGDVSNQAENSNADVVRCIACALDKQ